MDIVTGHVGSAHVTSWQDRDLNQGIFGPDTYILNVGSKLAATIISNNEIRIADGTLVMQGCQGVIQKGTYDSMTIDNGTMGQKRNDLICAEYTKVGGVESLDLVVIKGTPSSSTPSDPSYTSGDIQNGDALVQVPIYRASLNGLTLESVTALVNTAQPIAGIGTLYSDAWTGSSTTGVAYGGASVTLPVGLYLVFTEAHFAIGNTIGSYEMLLVSNPFPADITYYNQLGMGDSRKATGLDVLHASCVVDVREPAELIVNTTQTSGGNMNVTTQITALRLR